MKKTVIKISVSICIFFISLFVISHFMNKGNSDMTGEMGKASLPLLYIDLNGEKINCMYGYTMDMEVSYLRDTLTLLDENRSLNIVIDKFGSKINALSFEVRSIDGERLVEKTEVTKYNEDDNKIKTKITIKDLIEQEKEYNLIFFLTTEEGESITYYTRIISAANYFPSEKVEFVKYFNDCTFDKEKARDIVKYLETNAQGDNSSFGKVDIHSSFNQITWGKLDVKKVLAPQWSIKEIATQTATIHGEYVISVKEGKVTNQYRVKEYYRIRYTSDRMYLLDFEREMNQIFDENENVFINSKIMLGVQNQIPTLVESEGGNMFAFAAASRLFSYQIAENKFAVLFGFYDENNFDYRTLHDKHNIKILSVDETGNVRFMIYGYMNRGRHEGKVGIQVYYYNSLLNTIEEEVFIPYTKSYEMLKMDVEQLSYISKTNVLYLILDCSVYAIALDSKNDTIVASGLMEGNFHVSSDNRMLVLQDGINIFESKSLLLMNLNTQNKTTIEAPYGHYIMPLGFMDYDLIYGIAKIEDVFVDESGMVTFPMHTISIQNELGEVLKQYHQENSYITKTEIQENQLVLHRVEKNSTGIGYLPIENDQILNNEAQEVGKNKIENPVTDTYGKIIQIAVKSTINHKKMKHVTPKEVLFEGGRILELKNDAEIAKRYYVYSLKGAVGVFTNPGKAIVLAHNVSGVVVNEEGNYIWMKGNRKSRNQIMSITEENVTEEKSSLAVCINSILEYEGIMRNSEMMLKQGSTPIEILQEELPKAQVLDLSGCNLDMVFHFVNNDIPVLAVLNDGSGMLIVGFNATEVVLMDPTLGKLYKKSISETNKLFQQNGNLFISYIK